MPQILKLEHPEYLQIPDGSGSWYYGADQEWYPQTWQKRAGCGPTTASHLVLYNMDKAQSRSVVSGQQSMVALMQDVWQCVTPTLMGVHLVSQFTDGLSKYLHTQNLNNTIVSLPIPKNRSKRPSFEEIEQFLSESLGQDQPVAFLNLHHGDVANLDSWHWVTIVGWDEEKKHVQVYDAGKEWMIDLHLWYTTTVRAGGFASLRTA